MEKIETKPEVNEVEPLFYLDKNGIPRIIPQNVERLVEAFQVFVKSFKPLVMRTELWFCQDETCDRFAEPGTPGWVDDLGGPFCGRHS